MFFDVHSDGSCPPAPPTVEDPADLDAVVFDIPRLKNIVIDGDTADWGDQGLCAGPLSTVKGERRDPADYESRFRLGWDEEGLLFLGFVQDNYVEEARGFAEGARGHETGDRDCVQVFVGAKRGQPGCVWTAIGPGIDPRFSEPHMFRHDFRPGKQFHSEPRCPAASTRVPGGYVLEVRLPWKDCDIEPAEGREIGVQVWMVDSDRPGDWYCTVWCPVGFMGADKTLYLYRVKLVALRATHHVFDLRDGSSPPGLSLQVELASGWQ
jgi:hypothetical protein